MKNNITTGLLLIFCSSFQNQSTKKAVLIGSWTFEKFEYPNYISPDSKEVLNANNANKGLVITFTSDNKFVSKQTNGRSDNNTTTTYKILKDNKHLVINQDTTEIDRLDENYLILYAQDRPTITFKRKK